MGGEKIIMHIDGISIHKVLRDCPYNHNLKAKEADRGFIYDYEVRINGEHRADICRRYGNKWELSYPRGSGNYKEITFKNMPWPFSIGIFKYVVQKAIDAGVIPTLREIRLKIARERQEQRKKELAEQRAVRIRLVQDAGPRLLDHLKALVLAVRRDIHRKPELRAAEEMKLADELIAELEPSTRI